MKKMTLGIVAPVDAGKTTLAETLLHQGGTLRQLGRVDHGDAFLDSANMENYDLFPPGADLHGRPTIDLTGYAGAH